MERFDLFHNQAIALENNRMIKVGKGLQDCQV